MKIDMSQTLKTLEGKDLTEKDEDGKDKPITLGVIACSALLTPHQGEDNLSGEDKARRHKLAVRIVNAVHVDIVIDDVALLKKLIGKNPYPLYVGQAFEMLDPSPVAVEEDKEA